MRLDLFPRCFKAGLPSFQLGFIAVDERDKLVTGRRDFPTSCGRDAAERR